MSDFVAGFVSRHAAAPERLREALRLEPGFAAATSLGGSARFTPKSGRSGPNHFSPADPDGNPLALPPTELVKGEEMFDYRSKYLPGLSRKITPIDLPEADIQRIREACEEMFRTFGFQLLLATPMKMLQTIEDYVGGVVMVSNNAEQGSVLQELLYDTDLPGLPAADEAQQEVLI